MVRGGPPGMFIENVGVNFAEKFVNCFAGP